ncbi:histidine kinase [Marisediminicola senii]|uniref:histidine kinase n=1 Tax=Marisediminicola senii TaxID=2711233 RepID=UPI0013EC98F2|nr:histidine kinase [Marisediminicola senii]
MSNPDRNGSVHSDAPHSASDATTAAPATSAATTAVPVDPHPRVPNWVNDVVLSVLILGVTFAPAPVAGLNPSGPLETAIVLSPLLILPWRRRWPLPVLAVLLGLFGVAALLGTLSPGIGIAVAAAVFNVTNRLPRRIGLIATGVAVAAVIVLSLPASLGDVFEPRVVQFGLFVALAAAAGDGGRSRRDYIAAITERAERAERTREDEARRRVTEERLRIARDLHDAVAHQIAVISLNAGVASSTIDSRPERAKEALATIRGAARSVLGEIGDLLGVLRADDDVDAAAQPQPGLDRLDELVAQFASTGLDVHTRIDGDLSRVTGTPSRVGYRVLQEALTNAHKHGVEHRAHVLAEVDDATLALTVTNPTMGAGSVTGTTDDTTRSGLGLIGLRERVTAAGGTVETGPAAAGWKVVARMPLREGAR